MKALLYKDFVQMMKKRGWYTLFMLGFALVVVISDHIRFLFYPYLLLNSHLMSGIFSDESTHWDAFSRTMPFTLNQLVGEKYLLTVLMYLVLDGIQLAAKAVMALLRVNGMPFGDFAQMLLVYTALGVGMMCFMLPLLFRFGSQKGSAMYVGSIATVAAVMGAFAALDEGGALVPMNPLLLYGAAAAAIAVLPAVSQRIAVRLYAKRDF